MLCKLFFRLCELDACLHAKCTTKSNMLALCWLLDITCSIMVVLAVHEFLCHVWTRDNVCVVMAKDLCDLMGHGSTPG